MVECGRKRLASGCLLHRWCNRIGFRGWRDVFGEVLHHGGLWEEEGSKQTFVASMMQHTRVSRLERWVWRGVVSQWPVGRKRLASKCLLHCWCNTLGFQGLRDVTGEMLHHGGMTKEGLVSVCCIWVNVATNSYKPCKWDRAQFLGGRIVTVASWVMVATVLVLQQTMHKRREREGDYNSKKCCIRTTEHSVRLYLNIQPFNSNNISLYRLSLLMPIA